MTKVTVSIPAPSVSYINNLVDRRPPIGPRFFRWLLSKFDVELVRLP